MVLAKQGNFSIVFFLYDKSIGITEHICNMALNLNSLTEIIAVYDKRIEKTDKYLYKLKTAGIQVIDISFLEHFIKLQAGRKLIFHCQGFLHLKIASKLKRSHDKIVITVHAYRHYWRFWKFPLTLYLYSRYKSAVDIWHFLCGKSQKEFFWFRKFAKKPGKAFVFPLGVEDEFINSHSDQVKCCDIDDIDGEGISFNNGEKRIVYIADFNHVKRHKLLLRSLKNILKNDTVLYLLGDGPLIGECLEYTKRLGIQNNVVFTGRVSRDAVRSILSKASVAVVPSRSETFGWCLLEPFCMDKPIVTTNVGIADSLVQDFRNGFILDVNCKEEEFCDKVKYALEHLQNVDNSSMKNLYNWQTFSSNMKQCYDYVMDMR